MHRVTDVVVMMFQQPTRQSIVDSHSLINSQFELVVVDDPFTRYRVAVSQCRHRIIFNYQSLIVLSIRFSSALMVSLVLRFVLL